LLFKNLILQGSVKTAMMPGSDRESGPDADRKDNIQASLPSAESSVLFWKGG
jgi:hypothetical protein